MDAGRHCLRKWGFRRCEDICWIKTNKDPSRKYMLHQDPHACLQHTKVGAAHSPWEWLSAGGGRCMVFTKGGCMELGAW